MGTIRTTNVQYIDSSFFGVPVQEPTLVETRVTLSSLKKVDAVVWTVFPRIGFVEGYGMFSGRANQHVVVVNFMNQGTNQKANIQLDFLQEHLPRFYQASRFVKLTKSELRLGDEFLRKDAEKVHAATVTILAQL